MIETFMEYLTAYMPMIIVAVIAFPIISKWLIKTDLYMSVKNETKGKK